MEVNIGTAISFEEKPSKEQEADIIQVCIDDAKSTFKELATAWTCTLEDQTANNRRAAFNYKLGKPTHLLQGPVL